MPGEEVTAAAQDSDFATFDVDLDVVDQTFEDLIIEAPDRNGDSLDTGAIRVAEGALPEAGFARCAEIDDELSSPLDRRGPSR